ncbi:4 -phosphopantetheinyl transferase superfamily protein [Zymoseptoria brevis]|uniref:4-phosphopantetheinyl transferase superfamily protein n=1 Tax=Zymoseptoria brevis TaxID=1047168 RepID=A0A0F4GB25_9PEZI|nr:4 -phosphopantetheinyl transferase superfamily protein [Zymoseptoria brevis]
MPPRPFPLQLGIGIDIIHKPRLRRLVLKDLDEARSLRALLRRMLTQSEQREFWGRMPPEGLLLQSEHGIGTVVDYLAGRWAAKEAAIKAGKPRNLRLMEVEIRRAPEHDGRRGVYAVILDHIAEIGNQKNTLDRSVDDTQDLDDVNTHEVDTAKLAEDDRPGQVARISISHDGEYATAVCMAAESPLPGDVGGEAAARMP